MNQLIKNFRYRPEIDGLRALAVMAVVLFHAGLGVTGGFIGVDVFFVISGFLITSLIIKDLEAGKFTFASFWERRARRIIPASVVMVLAVLVAGWFLLLPSDYANLGKSTIWQSVFGANFYFWRNTNYFSGPADELPLLHTWSLAVEEQFYLFVPLLLVGVFRFPKLRSRRALLSLFGVGFTISLALSIYAVPRMPAVAFYLLPTRAWELLAGSTIAILPAVALSRPLREILCWLGLASILIPCFTYTKQTSFPGLAALPPCLGTALFIWASNHGAAGGHALPTSACLLATRPVVFIGLISYSLYLWHWPLLAFSHYWALEPLSLEYRLGMVAASFALAILSWRFVETPFRIRKLGTQRRSMFAYAGACLLFFSATGLLIAKQAGFRKRLSEAELRLVDAHMDPVFKKEVTLADAQSGRFPRIGDSEGPIHLMIWGDSHAMALLPAFADLCHKHHVGGLAATNSGTIPILGYNQAYLKNRSRIHDEAVPFNEAVFSYIVNRKIKNVVLVARWNGYINMPLFKKENGIRGRSDLADTRFGTSLLQTAAKLSEEGVNVWLLMSVPDQPRNVKRMLVLQSMFNVDLSKYQFHRSRYLGDSAEILSILPDLRNRGARMIDISNDLFDPDTDKLRMKTNLGPLYIDDNHLTPVGARLLSRQLECIFDPS